ncbi:hypothetical protein CTI12_AA002730 [Artemisia annua]|uniref:Uncharacterized protein n=1 Tax=Artemisia annua TaxID=35608 RepID=A0A2U1QNA5_ARTAN|nr:hypothetical protein CTI12_AA002730 [Artemisia annua]
MMRMMKKLYPRKKKGKGKKKMEEEEDMDDEDFVVKEKDNKKGKKKMEEEEDDKEKKFKSLRAKTTAKPFYVATHKLSPDRKQRVREMGFGSLIGFPIEKILTKLPYFLLKNLDVKTMEVKLPNGGVIKITPKRIREALGIPMGSKSFYAERQRPKEDTMYCKFMAQLPNTQRKRTTTALSNVIQKTEGTDFLFDLNYLMLFANCLVTCNNTAMLKYDVLENIKSSKDIPEIDWCTYIWNVLKQSKKKWKDTTQENWYYGPHLTFTLIYLHYTQFDEMNVPRKWPTIKNWNTELLEERETKEMHREELGLVMTIRQELVEENMKIKAMITKKNVAVMMEERMMMIMEEAEKEEAKKKGEAEEKRKAEEKKQAEKEEAKKAEEKRKAAAKELNEKRKKEKPLTDDETLLAYSVFSMEGHILDEVFDDGKGTTIIRITMQSLSPGIQIDTQNPEIQNDTKDLKAQTNRYVNVIDNDKTSNKLRDVKLVFIPIIAHAHYYVIVFDLEKGQAVILDNSIYGGDYDGKYRKIFVFVKEMLVHYFIRTEHPALNKFIKEAQPKIPKMKWKTKENKIDCGLYMIMHMEMFEGEIGIKWKTNIMDERNKQYADQIKKMRMRYAAKILLHDVNKKRKMVSDSAIKFAEEHGDKEKMKLMVEEAMKKKAEEEKN